jgi:ABC-type transport system involved in multi-copper enzyme maturation permease subunit
MKKGRPFLEIFASAAYEDYRFPILEIFAFLFALGQFAFTNLTVTSSITSGDLMIYWLVSSAMGITLFIFLILIFKNIAYGLGGDLEKGTIQTYFSYPLSRKKILTAKLLSAIGIAMLLFFGIQIAALVIQAPAMILPNIGIILLLYAANFGYVLLLTSIILLFALFIKKGVAALVVGIAIYFAIGIATSIVLLYASVSGSAVLLQAVTLLNPSTALSAHYGYIPGNIAWSPSLSEVTYYVVGNYVITALLFSLAYYYFSRRLSI